MIAGVVGGAVAVLALIGLSVCVYKHKTKAHPSAAAGRGDRKEEVQVTITHELPSSSSHPGDEVNGQERSKDAIISDHVSKPVPRLQARHDGGNEVQLNELPRTRCQDSESTSTAVSPEQYQARIARARLGNSAHPSGREAAEVDVAGVDLAGSSTGCRNGGPRCPRRKCFGGGAGVSGQGGRGRFCCRLGTELKHACISAPRFLVAFLLCVGIERLKMSECSTRCTRGGGSCLA